MARLEGLGSATPFMSTASDSDSASVPPGPTRPTRSERFLATLAPYREVVLVSHINPDPDALASMVGVEALLRAKQPDKPVTLTVDGLIARAENQEMVKRLEIPLVPVSKAPQGPGAAFVMVDTQPHTGRRANENARPAAVLDHHDTGGVLEGVAFVDFRPDLGATSTIVTGYLLEQNVTITPRVATALLYGIESEITGYPREASSVDDGALIWLYPRADKDVLAQIRNPKLPQSYFATFQLALSNTFLYGDVIVCWCGTVPQPDIIAEVADFFIKFDQVRWVVCLGIYQNLLKLSARVSELGLNCGEVLRSTVNGLGTAGGHDRRAGGAIPLTEPNPEAIDALRKLIRQRFLAELGVDEQQGRRLLEACPVVPVP
jgi:nanoRNase/pAp phosphatase (c-di-AMP/oligoRNAs hydrolase)